MIYKTTDGTNIDLSNLDFVRIKGFLYGGKPQTGVKISFNSSLRGYSEGDRSLKDPISVDLIGHLGYERISKKVNTDHIITTETRNELEKELATIGEGHCLVFETQGKFPRMLFSSAIKELGEKLK